MPRLFATRSLLVVLGLLLGCRFATAQQFSYNADRQQAFQSISFGYTLVDFEFDGDEVPAFSFDFAEPAFGATYTRPNLLVTVAYGTQDAAGDRQALSLLDLSLTTWGELYLAGLGANQTRIFIPIVLYSNYRRVAPDDNEDSFFDDFNVTVLGLGAGLGVSRSLGESAVLEARAHPTFGLASSSFVNALGTARLIDADVQLHLGRLLRRVGLSVGYNFKSQVWNVNGSDLFPDLTEELFDYKGSQHLFRVGFNW